MLVVVLVGVILVLDFVVARIRVVVAVAVAIAVGISIADAVVIDVTAFQLTGLVVKVQFCSWWGSEDLERKLKVKSGIGEIFALALPAGDIGRGCSAGAGQVRRQVGGFQSWGNLRRRRDWLRGVRVL